jgi:hypothetical protein
LTGALGKSVGVTPEELVSTYPKLYHMAADGAWPSIEKYGLLSTSRLLDLFEVPAETRRPIEEARRPNSVEIQHRKYGKAVIRDQKPLSEKRLKSCLKGCDVRTWLLMLNNRVFLWLDLARLKTMMSAKAYAGKRHTILTLDTLTLVHAHRERITLCPLNSGCTSPFAWPRGPHSFMPLGEYPFKDRKNRGPYGQVVELAVKDGVSDVKSHVTEVALGRCSNDRLTKTAILFKR